MAALENPGFPRPRRRWRWVAWGAGALTGVVALAVLAVCGVIYVTLPGLGGQARLPGLSAPVTVRFGPHGVPFIRAADAADAAEALGYLHARDRLFEMDLMRRAGQGRLAAWFGPRALGFDEHMRTLDLAGAAADSEPLLTPPTRALLAAYAAGVNARIAQCGRLCAWQYLFFGRPRPWRITDSLLWGELLGTELSGNADIELERLTLSKTLPRAKIAALWPAPAPPPPDTAFAPDALGAARQALAMLPVFPSPFRLTRTESNEFAVDGARSASGAPLLAGDPHLGFQFPSLWYLARIDTPDATLAGATAPGVPFLILGHNRRIAWTFTTNGAAVQDIFVFKRLDAGHYEAAGETRAFGVRREQIAVAGAKPVAFTVLTTIDGPVVGAQGDRVLALRAVNLTHRNRAADGLAALNAARSVAEAAQASTLVSAPVQNLLIADRAGIGLIVMGCVPRRAASDGAWPIDGSAPGTGWSGLACGDALPRFLAPASHVLVNTNEQVAPPGFPVAMGPDQFDDWRSQAIRRDLGQRAALTLQDFAATDYDIDSAYAAALLPRLAAIHPATGLARRAVALLHGWDGRMGRDLPQPLIFNAWLQAFRAEVLAANQVPAAMAGPAAMQFTQALLTDPAEAALFCGGDCTARLREAADHAMAALAASRGGDPARWRWGEAHRAVFYDPLTAAIPLLGGWLQPAISVPGDGSTVDRSASFGAGWTAVLGPSFRGVYDLADLDRSAFTLAPGESGDIFSGRARDFLPGWRNGALVTLPPRPAAMRAVLTLRPD